MNGAYDHPQPSGAEQAPNLEPRTAAPAIEYAGFWRRFLAVVVDSILLACITWPLLIQIYGWEYFESEEMIMGPADFLIAWVFPAVAVILFWIKKGATPGKMLARVRVVDSRSGQHITLAQAITRYLGYFVSGFVLLLGFIWVAFHPRKQGWHDLFAKTVVIVRTPTPSIESGFTGARNE